MNNFDYKRKDFKTTIINNKKCYFIRIKSQFIEVEKEVYFTIKRSIEKQRYLNKKEAKNVNMNLTYNLFFASFYFGKTLSDNMKIIINNDVIDIVNCEILKMEQKDRIIAKYVFINDYSDRQTAKILNLPQTTVSYRKRKIQKILQEKILEYCSYEDLFQQ